MAVVGDHHCEQSTWMILVVLDTESAVRIPTVRRIRSPGRTLRARSWKLSSARNSAIFGWSRSVPAAGETMFTSPARLCRV
ncbi:hypothetical protein R6V09_04020 [Streptomyces sp. W16]|uniref:hypothetical protein n=1 Tax=Streptomyces sp. W16 TaxID=3076631 RepID=UPI00295C1CD3|nr:hypothetical protein [Streptomyces sp. W16]MDV9169307.1 hypothetical protein [Streptomyces sp. W16]